MATEVFAVWTMLELATPVGGVLVICRLEERAWLCVASLWSRGAAMVGGRKVGWLLARGFWRAEKKMSCLMAAGHRQDQHNNKMGDEREKYETETISRIARCSAAGCRPRGIEEEESNVE